MFSAEMLQAFREFKSIWDPDWKMNPGKVIDAKPLDADLRLAPGGRPVVKVQTHFGFPHEIDGFASATLRCVGIGKCRKDEAGTMCPSYMVTREERHATRGRARLLYEMLRGDPVHDGWRSEPVHEALDLCLSCKGCRGECPVQVDMASYKAEFLSHYYEHHWRPRSAYAFGLIDVWAAIASRAPRLVNLLTQTPGFSAIAKVIAGMPQARRIPAFAPLTFREWFRRREATSKADGHVRAQHDARVMLWTDTFNNYFHPETAIAAVETLDDLGFDVEIPRIHFCCGRPLYDYGMLATARRRLEQIVGSLAGDIETGIPIIVLEPSCLAVFKDELLNMLPDDIHAQRLSRLACSLGEFLARHVERFPSVAIDRKALVHGHCHQKALSGLHADEQVFRRLGLDYTVIDSGCCGMAGSFGFERDHYAVSQAIGERRLLPAVRTAPLDTLIMADGFSCREQIAQSTNRRALHLADVLALVRRKPQEWPEYYPERPQVLEHARAHVPLSTAAGWALTAIGLGLVAIRAARTPRRQRQILRSSALRSSRPGPPLRAPRAEDIRSRIRRAPQPR